MYSAVAKVFFKLAICLVIAGAIATGTICSIYWHLKPGLPNSDFLNDYRAPEVTHVYDRHFRPIHEFAPVHRIN